MDNETKKEELQLEFDSIYVAAFILDYARKIGRTLSATQVQKILYCCYGVTLALARKRLTKEHPQAWPYGPVFPRVFNAISKGGIHAGDGDVVANSLPATLRYRLEVTIEVFSRFIASQLSAWTHAPGSPWDIATEHGRIVPTRMDDLAIMDFFKDQVVTKGLRLDSPLTIPTIQ